MTGGHGKKDFGLFLEKEKETGALRTRYPLTAWSRCRSQRAYDWAGGHGRKAFDGVSLRISNGEGAENGHSKMNKVQK